MLTAAAGQYSNKIIHESKGETRAFFQSATLQCVHVGPVKAVEGQAQEQKL